ncbi:MAG: DUF1269 domain-containing protein [Acidimicrobiia bacterium]|nr:DUF1269 domain-containing protein [Acidimicrobiia bacterium]
MKATKETGLDKDMLDETRDGLDKGTSALILMGLKGDTDEMTKAFEKYEPSKVIRHELPEKTVANLEQALGAAEEHLTLSRNFGPLRAVERRAKVQGTGLRRRARIVTRRVGATAHVVGQRHPGPRQPAGSPAASPRSWRASSTTWPSAERTQGLALREQTAAGVHGQVAGRPAVAVPEPTGRPAASRRTPSSSSASSSLRASVSCTSARSRSAGPTPACASVRRPGGEPCG